MQYYINQVEPTDFGILYGFSVFESFYIKEDSSVFLLQQHIQRLFSSLDFFKIPLSITQTAMMDTVSQHIITNQIKDQILRITVTHGSTSSNKPALLLSMRKKNKNFAITTPVIIGVSDVRINETSPLSYHLTGNRLDSYLEMKTCSEKKISDILFLNTEGSICETARANIFWVKDNHLYTPALSCGIIPGIMRQWVIEQANSKGLKCHQGHYPLSDIFSADEIFMTSSADGIVSVSKIVNQAHKIF